ncbi:MAG: hypothetical protein FJ109_14645 [Deltaproteobacteria bacterium]|nr:hypothetical protein [Deltaproteobacteria bacterium]
MRLNLKSDEAAPAGYGAELEKGIPEPVSLRLMMSRVLAAGSDPAGRYGEVAARVLEDFPDGVALVRCSPSELSRRYGIEPERARLLCDALRMGIVWLLEPRPLSRVDCAEDVYLRFAALGWSSQEQFLVLSLDHRNQVLGEHLVARGTGNLCVVQPREVLGPVLRDMAGRALLVHNHPSGDPAPSHEDVEMTRRLDEASRLVGVEILDHVVVGRGRFASMLDLELLPDRRKEGERGTT